MSYVNALFHIVICTYQRKPAIPAEFEEDVYRFIWDMLKQRSCRLLRINGIGNHIHLFIDLKPSIALADLVRDIKACTSGWMRRDFRFHTFEKWSRGYFAASVSYSLRDSIIEYIKWQHVHHGVESIDDEMKRLCEEQGMIFHEDSYE